MGGKTQDSEKSKEILDCAGFAVGPVYIGR